MATKKAVQTEPDQRRAIHAYLSAGSHSAWQFFADQHGTSISALLEAIGMALDSDTWPTQSVLVDEARKIDADRRRRKR